MTADTCPDCGALLEVEWSAGHRPGCPRAEARLDPAQLLAVHSKPTRY